MPKRYELTYQSLVICYTDPKILGTKIRDLKDQGAKNLKLTPKGLEYTTGRISIFVGNISYQHHEEPYPDGVTATGYHSVEVNIKGMIKILGTYPRPTVPKPKPIHRTWMTQEEYEALNPTIGSMLT